MCHHMTLLAKASAYRYITQCEHSTVHLVWDRAVLQLQAGETLVMAAIFERWEREPQEAIDEAPIHLQRFRSGNVHLWFGGIALFLAPPDLDMLSRMVRTAAGCIAVAAIDGHPVGLREQIAAHQMLEAMPLSRFSPN